MTENEKKKKVLIVGAGAMGLTLGYQLHLADVEITYLVKPARADGLSRPQVLYSYDDSSLKTFAEFKVSTAPEFAATLAPDYIIVTLDGAATTSPEGTALLRALGEAVRAADTVIIGGGVGMGLRDHYLNVTGLPGNRVLMATLGCFAYQVKRVNLPVHPPTDPDLLSQADVAYRYPNKNGLLLQNSSPAAAKRFIALYNANGTVRCTALETHLFDIATNAPFAILAGSDLLGWPPITDLPKHKEVWQITVDAVREISRLKQNGWRGKFAGLLLTKTIVAKGWASIDKNSLPLDYQAFNAFHHGAKVAAQDSEIMRACVTAGEREGQPMTALRELLRRMAEKRPDRRPS